MFGKWFHQDVGDEDYLILQNQKGRMTLCSMVSLQEYTSQYPIPTITGNSLVSVFSTDKIISSQEALDSRGLSLDDLLEGVDPSRLVLRNGNLVLSYFLEECQTGISVVTPLSEFVLLASERFLVAAVFLLLTALMFTAFYAVSNRLLLMPVLQICHFSKEIEKIVSTPFPSQAGSRKCRRLKKRWCSWQTRFPSLKLSAERRKRKIPTRCCSIISFKPGLTFSSTV